MKIQRLIWAGLKIECGDTTALVDAVTHFGGWDEATQGPVTSVEIHTSHCAALITHGHDDHYDRRAVQQAVGDSGLLVCEEGTAISVSNAPFTVWKVRLYEPVLLPWTVSRPVDLVAFAVPAADGFAASQVSWVIDGGGKRIIHCGDTAWHSHWWNIARAYGPFDAAFLPINGVTYDRGRLTGSRVPFTLTPDQAATAAHLLRARLAIPIHYETFTDDHYIEYPKAEATFLKEAKTRGVETRLVEPGAWLEW